MSCAIENFIKSEYIDKIKVIVNGGYERWVKHMGY